MRFLFCFYDVSSLVKWRAHPRAREHMYIKNSYISFANNNLKESARTLIYENLSTRGRADRLAGQLLFLHLCGRNVKLFVSDNVLISPSVRSVDMSNHKNLDIMAKQTYFCEAHRKYMEALTKEVEEMSRHPLSQEQFRAQTRRNREEWLKQQDSKV